MHARKEAPLALFNAQTPKTAGSSALAPDPQLLTPELPSKEFIATLARQIAEIADGVRDIRALERWLTPAAAEHLQQLSQQRGERNHLFRGQAHSDSVRSLYFTGTAHIQAVSPLKLEINVTVQRGGSAFAVVVVLEWIRSRWRVSYSTVL